MLALNFEICQVNSCKDLVFSETTGAYNATYNLTGWGTPNLTLAEAASATLTITNPSGGITIINLVPQGFPTDDLTLDGYTIASATALPDGQYTFTYTVVSNANPAVTYTKTISKLFYCNSECCVTKMLPYIEECDTCQSNISSKNYIIAWTTLESLKAAASCGDVTSFTNLLRIITNLCKNSACKTCN